MKNTFKPIWTFKYTLRNGSEVILGTGRYTKPERSKMWRHLQELFNDRDDIASITYKRQLGT